MQDVVPTTSMTKEDAKAQFDYYTKVLGIKHVFSFDEVWDTLLESRLAKQRKQDFRMGVKQVHENIKNLPGSFGPDPFPLTHTFAGGMYVRYLTVPPRALTVTRIHKQEHVFFLLKGTISVLTEDGVKKFTAPHFGITKVGTQRIIWHHDEVIFVTVHATPETTREAAEEKIFTEDFSEIDSLDTPEIHNFIELVSKEEG